MTMPIRLRAVATAVPPHTLAQEDVRESARRVFGPRVRDFERFAPVFANAAIETRQSCVPLEWYLVPHGWDEKNALYLDHAVALLERAASSALDKAGTAAQEVAAVVTVSSTGIATPSLDARLMERLAIPRHAHRLPIFGLGCAGGVLGLGRAALVAAGLDRGPVLLLVVELCALTFRHSDPGNANLVATALFGDGAAAAVVQAGAPGTGPVVTAWGEHTWPDSLDVMGWRVAEDGLGVVFAPSIPALIRENLRPVVLAFLARHGLSLADLDGVICHPGGAKVLEALEAALAPCSVGLAEAWEVLRRYGNMSAASVLFVLERRLRQGLTGRHLMTALGPGFTAGFAVLEA